MQAAEPTGSETDRPGGASGGAADGQGSSAATPERPCTSARAPDAPRPLPPRSAPAKALKPSEPAAVPAISYEAIMSVAHLPQREAASALGVPESRLRNACWSYGMMSWPRKPAGARGGAGQKRPSTTDDPRREQGGGEERAEPAAARGKEASDAAVPAVGARTTEGVARMSGREAAAEKRPASSSGDESDCSESSEFLSDIDLEEGAAAAAGGRDATSAPAQTPKPAALGPAGPSPRFAGQKPAPLPPPPRQQQSLTTLSPLQRHRQPPPTAAAAAAKSSPPSPAAAAKSPPTLAPQQQPAQQQPPLKAASGAEPSTKLGTAAQPAANAAGLVQEIPRAPAQQPKGRENAEAVGGAAAADAGASWRCLDPSHPSTCRRYGTPGSPALLASRLEPGGRLRQRERPAADALLTCSTESDRCTPAPDAAHAQEFNIFRAGSPRCLSASLLRCSTNPLLMCSIPGARRGSVEHPLSAFSAVSVLPQ